MIIRPKDGDAAAGREQDAVSAGAGDRDDDGHVRQVTTIILQKPWSFEYIVWDAICVHCW